MILYFKHPNYGMFSLEHTLVNVGSNGIMIPYSANCSDLSAHDFRKYKFPLNLEIFHLAPASKPSYFGLPRGSLVGVYRRAARSLTCTAAKRATAGVLGHPLKALLAIENKLQICIKLLLVVFLM